MSEARAVERTSSGSASRPTPAGARSATSPSTTLACQAIQRAVDDAGLSMDDVDGMASFAEDRNEAVFLAAELGLPALRFANMVWMPGRRRRLCGRGQRRHGGGDRPGRSGRRLPLALPGAVLPLRQPLAGNLDVAARHTPRSRPCSRRTR